MRCNYSWNVKNPHLTHANWIHFGWVNMTSPVSTEIDIQRFFANLNTNANNRSTGPIRSSGTESHFNKPKKNEKTEDKIRIQILWWCFIIGHNIFYSLLTNANKSALPVVCVCVVLSCVDIVCFVLTLLLLMLVLVVVVIFVLLLPFKLLSLLLIGLLSHGSVSFFRIWKKIRKRRENVSKKLVHCRRSVKCPFHI